MIKQSKLKKQMTPLVAGYSKAQMKIQQTAFMLVALVLFFSMVGLIYFSISLANLRAQASQLYEKEALETVKMLSGVPEFAFTSSSDCTSCVDLDKVFALSKTNLPLELWNFDYLEVERVYPKPTSDDDCTEINYPDNCKRIKLIKRGSQKPKTAFVTLVRWDLTINNYRYELGKIHATEKNITR